MYRGCSVFHKIRHNKVKEKEGYDPSENFCITLTKDAGIRFKDDRLYEIVFNEGVLLLKSGCDLFKKTEVTIAIK